MGTSAAACCAVGSAVLGVVLALPSAGATVVSVPSAPSGQGWVWPLQPVPTVVRGFDAPAHPWEAGHRGVDLQGVIAQPVLAIGAGDVRFASTLAGRGVVVIGHGALRSTYEPVTAAVHVGEHVRAGQVIGLLQATHSHCAPETCLHLGLRRGTVYLDPLSVLGPRPVRLKPLSPSDPAPLGPPTDRAAPQAAAGPRTVRTEERASADFAAPTDEGRARTLRALSAEVSGALTSLLASWVGSYHSRR